MKTTTEDRRVQRTKAAIQSALLELIREKGFDKLTVKDISDRANINRGTFYLHYQDKFDLLDKTVQEIGDQMEHMTAHLPVLLSHGQVSKDSVFGMVKRLFEFFADNVALIQALFLARGSDYLFGVAKNIMNKNLHKLEHFRASNGKPGKIHLADYLITYIISAHTGIIRQWLDNGTKETPEEMARFLVDTSFDGPLHLLGVFLQPEPNEEE